MDIKDLAVLEDGTVIENRSYGTYVIGHSTELATWIKIWESSKYSINSLKELVSKVWDKIPTPTFEVVYRRYNGKLDSIYKLSLASSSELEKQDIKVRMDDVKFITSNPFVLSNEDQERVQVALDSFNQQKDAEWAVRHAHHKAVGEEILVAIQSFVESNATFTLEERVFEGEVSIFASKVSVIANGVEIASIKLMEFTKQVFPELWEKYKSI